MAQRQTALVPPLNPLFEREWRERFRRFAGHAGLGLAVVILSLALCYGAWRANGDAPLSALAWRAQGKDFLAWYRVIGGLVLWAGALLLGAVAVSDEKSAGTWEHLLLCPFGGRGLAIGKIASSAAFLLMLQLTLAPVLFLAGELFAVSPREIAGVMGSHFLLTLQGATLGFWGALRGRSLGEGLAQSLGGITQLAGQSVALVIGVSWVVIPLGAIFAAASALAPTPFALVFKWILVAGTGALWLGGKAFVSGVAGATGLGVAALSFSLAAPFLLAPFVAFGQLVGAAMFLKWSAWEVDYPAREFGHIPAAPPSSPPIFKAPTSSAPFPPAPRPTISKPAPRPTAVPPPRPHRVPPPPVAGTSSRPALFGSSSEESQRAPIFGQTDAPIFNTSFSPDSSRNEPSAPAELNSTQGVPACGPFLPGSSKRVGEPPDDSPLPGEVPRHTPLWNDEKLLAPKEQLRQKFPFPTEEGWRELHALARRDSREFAPPKKAPTRNRVLFRVWSWSLSPAQLAAFPAKELRAEKSTSRDLLFSFESSLPKTSRRLRAPVSRRLQELNPVLWLDLTRCLSLRSPDSAMIPVLLTLGGAMLFSVGMFLLVSWAQTVFGGSQGDVSSLAPAWNNLHWVLHGTALGCGPIWGATGYVVERRTGMLAELRLSLLGAKSLWWGKFLARFGIFALASLPMLAMVAFFAANWPGKNATFEVAAALVSSWALGAWSVTACLWISDSSRRELAAALGCGAFALAWAALGWNFPTFAWTPLHLLGATLAGGHLWWRLKRMGFG